MFAGRECADQLGGPIRIAQISGQVATLGFVPVLHLAAMLSVSIGLLNLFPVPLLDGGHLLFYAIEAVRGRPLSMRAQEIGFRIGFAIVVMLMIFAVFNDTIQLAASLGVMKGCFGVNAPRKSGKYGTLRWVADWEKACRNMVLSRHPQIPPAVGKRVKRARCA